MKIGDVASVKYVTGEVFNGEVVNIRTIGPDRILFTVHDAVGFRSLYVDRCENLEIMESASN